MTGEDAELRARFRELRALDVGGAPPFEAPAAARPAALMPRRWLGIGLAAAAVLAAIVLGIARFPGTVPDRDAAALETWRAGTDALLDHASPVLFGDPLPIGSSVVDRFIPETEVFKGD